MSRHSAHAKAAHRKAHSTPHHRAASTGETPLPRIAAALKEQLRQTAAAEKADLSNVASYPFKGLNHEQLHAYEERGRQLHAEASAEILIAGARALGRLVKRGAGAIAHLFEPAEPPAHLGIHEAYRRGSPFEVPFHYNPSRARWYGVGL